MATNAELIVAKLDELILAKLNGVGDISELFDQEWGRQIKLDGATSLEKLTAMRKEYAAMVVDESTDAGEYDMYVVRQ